MIYAFPFMMFGLPAAALAMVHEAKPEKKKFVAGIMASAALTSFNRNNRANRVCVFICCTSIVCNTLFIFRFIIRSYAIIRS